MTLSQKAQADLEAALGNFASAQEIVTALAGGQGSSTPGQSWPLARPGVDQALTTSLAAVPDAAVLLRDSDWTAGGTPYYRLVAAFAGSFQGGDVLEFDFLDGVTGALVLGGTATAPTITAPATAADSGPSALNGTAVGTPLAVGSPWSGYGVACQITSGGAGFDCGGTGFGWASAGTVECKVQRSRAGVTESVVGKWGTGAGATSGAQYLLYFDSSDKLNGGCYDGAGTFHGITGATSVGAGTTHDVALSWDGTTLRLFLDGVSQGTPSAMASINATNPTTAHFTIGAFSSSGFVGTVDEVRVSSTARYTAGYTPATAPFASDASTLALYHFGGSSGAGFRAQTGWTAVPAAASLQTVALNVRNQTAARGALLAAWLEVTYQ